MDTAKTENRVSSRVKRLERKLSESGNKGSDECSFNSLQNELGQAYLDMGHFEKALDIYKSLSEETHKEEKFQGLFRTYIESKRYDKAKGLIPSILKDLPDSSSLLNSIGLFYYRTGDNYEALRYFDRAQRASSSDLTILVTILYNKAMALNEVGYFEEAQKILEPLALSVEDSSFSTELAYSYLNNGKTEKAVDIYEALRKKHIISSSVYGGLYCAYLELEKHDRAFKIAEEGIRKLPRSYPSLYENLAEAYQWIGNTERKLVWLKKAITVVRKGLEIFPGDERLVGVLKSIEEHSKFLEEDLKQDAWRKRFKESSLTEDTAPVLILAPLSLVDGDEDDLDMIFGYLWKRKWFRDGRLFSFDIENHVILYRKNIGMELEDYIETTKKIKKGTKIILIEIDERKRYELRPKMSELCGKKALEFLQCTPVINGKTGRVLRLKWSDLSQKLN